jgi:tetratricopeptide (TPR) repeat protein
VALAGYNTGLTDPAIGKATLDAVDRALDRRPGWDRAGVLKGEILAKGSRESGIVWLRKFVTQTSDPKAVRTALAQMLVEDRRYADAREIYRRLVDENPSQREYQFALAIVAMQMKDWATAEEQLLALKAAGFGEDGVVELSLAQVAEEQKRYDEAIQRYRAVPDGERGWVAKLRIASVMGKQGKLDQARRYLQDLPAVTIDERVQVRQAEAQLLRDAGELAAAYDVLGKGLEEHPDAPDLIYDRAMVAEKLDRIPEAEAALRRLLTIRPDDPQTLNALGYTLVDRTTRIDEGFVLIQKAHALAPSDPFILDSMGWALYRLGRMDEATDYLKRALADRADPEIAAHLGEVLWAKGEPDRAREVWQSQLKLTPDNPVLLETVRRHAP